MSDVVKVFVGADESQSFAVPVLEHSIKRHTELDVEVVSLQKVAESLPAPEDMRHSSRTGFSFTRFAIPELVSYSGRAIYLDADMQVFTDIAELWQWPMHNQQKVLIMKESRSHKKGIIKRKRHRQSSVMLIDCEACRWDVNNIIRNLGRKYSYEELLDQLCILSDEEIGDVLPDRWNSLEKYSTNTSLIHYTDMMTQPWVDPGNPLGYVWVNEVRLMLENGALEFSEVKRELAKGYLRPSLAVELKLPIATKPPSQETIDEYRKIDNESGYVKHRKVIEESRNRVKEVQLWENSLSVKDLLLSMPSRESRRPISRIKYFINSML